MPAVNTTPAVRPAATTDPYHLPRPDLAEAREALHQLYGNTVAETLWATLLGKAGLTGRENDPASLDRLLAVMLDVDPVTSLCARSLAIRAGTHTRLSAVHALIRNAE